MFFDNLIVFFRFLAEKRLRMLMKSPQKPSSRPKVCKLPVQFRGIHQRCGTIALRGITRRSSFCRDPKKRCGNSVPLAPCLKLQSAEMQLSDIHMSLASEMVPDVMGANYGCRWYIEWMQITSWGIARSGLKAVFLK